MCLLQHSLMLSMMFQVGFTNTTLATVNNAAPVCACSKIWGQNHTTSSSKGNEMHTQCTTKATFITTSQDNLHFFKLNFTDFCLHYSNFRFMLILFKEPNLYCIHYVYLKNRDLISFFATPDLTT